VTGRGGMRGGGARKGKKRELGRWKRGGKEKG